MNASVATLLSMHLPVVASELKAKKRRKKRKGKSTGELHESLHFPLTGYCVFRVCWL